MNIREKLYRFKYIYGPQLNHRKPVDVSLELSSSCNQRCGYCYHSDQSNLPFSKGLMDTRLASMIIDQCADLGVNSIKFNYRGESTMHPSFKFLTHHARSWASGSTFIDRITNSNFKFSTDNEEIFQGLSYQTKVKVSFDSFIPSVMEKQRAGSIHKLCLDNIEKFYNHPSRIKYETKIVIQAVRTLLNKDEDIAGEVKRRWPEAQVSIRDMVAGRVDKDLSELENRERDTSERQTCIQAHSRIIVGHDGRVQACCPDIGSKLILGDANKETIYDIWNSEKAKKLREALKNKKAFKNEPCKSCSSFESYKGYRAPKDS
jgi:radical SAM protein with 4Fe4S-binding SPASM domain